MALASKSYSRWPSRFHFVLRFLALTGFLALVVAGFMIFVQYSSTPALSDLAPKDGDTFQELGNRYYDISKDAVTYQAGDALFVAACLICGGLLAIVAWLLVEGVIALRWTAASRGAAGFLALLQVGLALALLIGV